jgi:hypothetical protein
MWPWRALYRFGLRGIACGAVSVAAHMGAAVAPCEGARSTAADAPRSCVDAAAYLVHRGISSVGLAEVEARLAAAFDAVQLAEGWTAKVDTWVPVH